MTFRYQTLRQRADVKLVIISCERCANDFEVTVGRARATGRMFCPSCLGAVHTATVVRSVERVEAQVWREHLAELTELRTRPGR